ncbi:MAG: GAF domain-containing protein [Chloroflexi bacterium]|nr:GAF domain-containing protein [Chloroflexota bacterium]
MSVDPEDFLTPFQPNRHLFQTFADKAEVVFWVADPVSFQLVYVSPHAEKALGVPPNEWLRPLFWQKYLYEADLDRVLAGFGTAVGSGIAHQLEYRLKVSDGSLRWIRDTVCVLSAEDKSLLWGMMTDVTAYKTAVYHQTDTPGFTSVFLEIVTLLTANVETEQMLNQVAEKLCEVFEVTAVNILEWNNDLGIATQLAHHQIANTPILSEQSNSYTLAGLEGRLKWLTAIQPVVTYYDDPDLTQWEQEYLQKQDAKTVLYLPLLGQNELLGCIELVESRNARRFTQKDIELSKIVAQQTAVAIVKIKLFQDEARRRREAEILLDVAEFVSSSLDRDEILSRVMEIIRVYLEDAQNCAISLITEDGEQLETILSWWANDEFALMPMSQIIQIKETFSTQIVVEGGEPVVITDLKKIPFTNEFTSQKIKEGLRTILGVPLKIQDRVIGILHIYYWHNPRQFTVEEIALLHGVASQAAIAIENARLFANERRQLQLSQTLQKVGSLLTASLQLEEVYEQIFDLLGQVISYGSSSLFLFDEENAQFFLTAFRGTYRLLADVQNPVLPYGYVVNQIPISPGWMVVHDVKELGTWMDYGREETIKSWIGAFLIVKGKLIGVLNVDGFTSGQFSEEEGQMVAAFANQAAIAIENAHLHDETMRQAKELAILNQVAQETAVSLNIDTFLKNITKKVVADIYPDVFGFALATDDGRMLKYHPSYHGVPETIKQYGFSSSQGIAGHVFQSGQSYISSNVHEDTYYDLCIESSQSEVAVPLKVNYEVIGVINVESPELDAFSNKDVDFLMTLAGNIAAVLERARLYDTLRIQAASLADEVAKRTTELEFERDRLFAVLESAGEGIILTNMQAQIEYANPAMERLSGYSREEVQEQNPRIYGSQQVPKSTFNEMWHNLLNRRRWVGELINQNKNGENYDVAVTITPIVDAANKVTGYISVQSNISRLKEVERLKAQFIAHVSHQLRTPLTNIKTYVSLLKKGRPEKFPHYFSVLHYEIDRLARLIQDLLDISRLDVEGAPDSDAAVDFCEFWAQFWPPFMERAQRESRILQTILPDDVAVRAPTVFMEAYQLEKLLSRLVENELAYSNEGGKIVVEVAWKESHPEILEIKICDDGPSIPEDERPFVFDRFFRGEQAIESGLPGNGLGLSIVRELLTRYGGNISLESDLGVGSCFTLQLPLVTVHK